jgi:hypothetical protein
LAKTDRVCQIRKIEIEVTVRLCNLQTPPIYKYPASGGPAPLPTCPTCLFKTNSQKSVCTKRHLFRVWKVERDLPPKKRTETLRIFKTPCHTWEPGFRNGVFLQINNVA